MYERFIKENFESGQYYEEAIRRLLTHKGFHAIKPSTDRGVDIIATTEINCKELVFNIQCKCSHNTVALAPIQEIFTGTEWHNNNGYPVVMTNNHVTAEARKFASELGVEIIALPEWQELQDSYTSNTVFDKTRRGLMGLLLNEHIDDMEFSKTIIDSLTTKTEEPDTQDDELDKAKKIIKQLYANADKCEDVAAEHYRKASYSRKESIEWLALAALKTLEYG